MLLAFVQIFNITLLFSDVGVGRWSDDSNYDFYCTVFLCVSFLNTFALVYLIFVRVGCVCVVLEDD